MIPLARLNDTHRAALAHILIVGDVPANAARRTRAVVIDHIKVCPATGAIRLATRRTKEHAKRAPLYRSHHALTLAFAPLRWAPTTSTDGSTVFIRCTVAQDDLGMSVVGLEITRHGIVSGRRYRVTYDDDGTEYIGVETIYPAHRVYSQGLHPFLVTDLDAAVTIERMSA